ncbi:MAG: spore photoproduct lyase [Herpetosiphon sp.]
MNVPELIPYPINASAKICVPGQWMPERVYFTPSALAEPWGQQIHSRLKELGLSIEELAVDRLPRLKETDAKARYRSAKRTLAVVKAPPSAFKLQPIPPSADWQFHLATGCPAHCQYCYLAGSLQGPPITRVFANLPEILDNLQHYLNADGTTSFEASCYTDPLSIEHLTGSLAECIRYFGTMEHASLRWVTKFADVQPLLGLPHNNHTRCRISVNAAPITARLEGGTALGQARLAALRQLALPRSEGGGGYPIGLVIAPIMPILDWRSHYKSLLDIAASMLDFPCDLTIELITHRFTEGSREVLQSWYPRSALDMSEQNRTVKRHKYGGIKYVYNHTTMSTLRRFFEDALHERFPTAKILYWT